MMMRIKSKRFFDLLTVWSATFIIIVSTLVFFKPLTVLTAVFLIAVFVLGLSISVGVESLAGDNPYDGNRHSDDTSRILWILDRNMESQRLLKNARMKLFKLGEAEYRLVVYPCDSDV
jgi:hypothetical protein